MKKRYKLCIIDSNNALTLNYNLYTNKNIKNGDLIYFQNEYYEICSIKKLLIAQTNCVCNVLFIKRT